MDIRFEVDGKPARFRLSAWNGRADLSIGSETFLLQSPWKLRSQYQVSKERTWSQPVGEHLVEIVKERPLVAPTFRAASFTVLVDGNVTAQQRGK